MRPLGLKRPGNILATPDYNNHVLLSTTPQAFDMPSGAAYMNFSATVDFAVKIGSTGVAWPSTNVLDGSGSEINPTVRGIGSTKSSTGFSVVAGSSGLLTIGFFGPGG